MRLHLKSIDNAHGGGAALPMATWYLENEISPLLNERSQPISRQLIEVVAEFHCDVGWAAYDSGEQEQASKYFRSALRFAHAAGNRVLGGRIQAAMSHQAVYLGNVRQAIEFAQAARAATRQLATPRAVAMLAAMEACAHAAAGDARRSERALDDAAAALTSVVDGEPEPDWLDFDEGGYWGHAARAYRDLGQLQKAEQYAGKSVGLCLAGHSRTRAQRNAIQATAHLRMKEVDAAAAAGLQVVNDAWNLHSGHVFTEIAQLAAAITSFGAPEAKEFVEQARELLITRAPGVLTNGQPVTTT
jgi:tetratricopeptide (TPR) repeat protein